MENVMPDEPQAPIEAPAEAGTTLPAVQPQAAAPEALEWPKKFLNKDGTENREAFLKGYQDLQHTLATTKRVSADQPDSLALPKDVPIDDNAGVEEIVRAAGLDPAVIGQQFQEKGNLTAAQYKAFKAKGMPRGMIDTYMKMNAKVNQIAQAELLGHASKLAGGEEQFKTVLNWAKNSLTPEERNFYGSQIDNPDNALMGVEWLLGKYRTAVGADNAQPLISGTGVPTATGGFTSQAEMHKAQNDPRYRKEKAYRASVDARIGATDDGTIMGLA